MLEVPPNRLDLHRGLRDHCFGGGHRDPQDGHRTDLGRDDVLWNPLGTHVKTPLTYRAYVESY